MESFLWVDCCRNICEEEEKGSIADQNQVIKIIQNNIKKHNKKSELQRGKIKKTREWEIIKQVLKVDETGEGGRNISNELIVVERSLKRRKWSQLNDYRSELSH